MVILTSRNAERLKQTSTDVSSLSVSTFYATDTSALGKFFANLP